MESGMRVQRAVTRPATLPREVSATGFNSPPPLFFLTWQSIEKETEVDLTAEVRAQIDATPYEELLRQWRFAPTGDPMFQGESGTYFAERMKELRSQPGGNERHVAASKSIGR